MIESLYHNMITGGAEMAYKIQYSQETNHRYPPVGHKKKIKPAKWAALALLLAALLWMRQKGVPDFLIPGDPEVTKTAAAALIDELQNNVPIGEAVAAFCETIIHGAGI